MVVNVIDGKTYPDAASMPDYGQWTCTKAQGPQRDFWGMSAEVNKLPTNVGTGSTAYCVDSQELYFFHDGTWYAQS